VQANIPISQKHLLFGLLFIEQRFGRVSEIQGIGEAVMAKQKKATGKTKAKRKKTRAKAPTREKMTTVRKAEPITKKTASKSSHQGVSPRKAKPIPAKPTPVRPTATPRPPQPVPAEQRIGVVTHHYSHLSVATLRLEPGATLRIGDVIHVLGHTTDFSQRVESLEVDRKSVLEVGSNDHFGLKVIDHAREHDVVFKVRS
jgi:putative protease